MKVIVKSCVFVLLVILGSYFYTHRSIKLPPESIAEKTAIKNGEDNLYPLKIHNNGYNVFELVGNISGVDPKILQGYAATEGHWNQYAVGDNGISHGLMQINSRYRKDWVKLCGYEYDPYDLFDAVYVCSLIYKRNSAVFPDDTDAAISAYCQGITGVKNNGVILAYAESVRRYCND